MSSKTWTATFFLFLCFCSALTDVLERKGLRETGIFINKDIVFDHQPLEDNALVFAACIFDQRHTNMNCTVFLWSLFTGSNHYNKTCQVNYQAEKGRIIDKDQYQLRLLFDNQVLFLWSDKETNAEDLSLSSQNVFFRTIDMSTCSSAEGRIPYQSSREIATKAEDFYIVPYDDTFDIFFRNDSLCGDMMCGESYNKAGKIINGPVASYLPTRFVKSRDTVIHPVKPKSPLLGHFLLSSSQVMKLVSSTYGVIKDLMEFPVGVNSFAYSCDNGFLGFCWISGYARRNINCTQFDSKGSITQAGILELDYNAGKWMAMYNLADGGFLLLLSQCDDDNWCDTNVDRVAFVLIRVEHGGGFQELYKFIGVDCNYAQDFKADIVLRGPREVTVSLACHVRSDTGEESRVVLKAKNIRI